MFVRVVVVVLALFVPSTAFAQEQLTGVVLDSSGAQSAPATTGVLLLAHGGQPQWNAHVSEVAKRVSETQPTEVAFGMASRASIQAAVDKLTARGVTRIVAVPLFVSSHSSVITSTEFLLGLRSDAPADLARFAKMDHRSHGATDHTPSHADPASPVRGDCADDRVSIEGRVRKAAPFANVDYMTVRDDAGPEIREAATRDLRGKVQAQIAQGRRVLIVPHLMSFGGIEQGLRKTLEGLDYVMTAQALMPDDRVVQWVLASVQ